MDQKLRYVFITEDFNEAAREAAKLDLHLSQWVMMSQEHWLLAQNATFKPQLKTHQIPKGQIASEEKE